MRPHVCKLCALVLLLASAGAMYAGEKQETKGPLSAQANLDQVPALNLPRLDNIRDDTALGNWAHTAPEEMPQEARDEDAVFWQAVQSAFKGPAATFAQAAEKNRHLTFGHLYAEPGKYRGQIVHFEGRLVRLKQLDPPHHAQMNGVRVLFEAWVFLNQPGAHPICMVMPHKPKGIEVGDGLNQRVEVNGYFFKRYRYISGRVDAAGNNLALNTLLLIGPTATLQESAGMAHKAEAGMGAMWPWLGGFAAGGALLILAMAWWFHRGDRQVRTRLQAFRVMAMTEQPNRLFTRDVTASDADLAAAKRKVRANR